VVTLQAVTLTTWAIPAALSALVLLPVLMMLANLFSAKAKALAGLPMLRATALVLLAMALFAVLEIWLAQGYRARALAWQSAYSRDIETKQ
jgi:hypothetical protein